MTEATAAGDPPATAAGEVSGDLDDPRRDADGHLVDGHGNRLYKVEPDTAAAHQAAVAAGWRHTGALTPYGNLRALAEVLEREGVATERRLERVAFRFIAGYGPSSTHRALDRLGVTA
jgi:hypothetical protein